MKWSGIGNSVSSDGLNGGKVAVVIVDALT